MSPRSGERAQSIPRSVLEAEIVRIVGALDGNGVALRLLGSLAVSVRCPASAALLLAFDRTYADIDVAAYRRDAGAVSAYFASIGYVQDREVAMTSEGRRGLYDHPSTAIHIDVFYDRLEFCHVIPLGGRLEREQLTIPLAELLLSKLQIVKINEKDVVDLILLLLDHELAEGGDVGIEADRVARLCASDWGLWRTVTQNLDKVAALAATYPQLDPDQRGRVAGQIAALATRLDAEPKTFGWRARARVGARVKWWNDVDEVR